MRNWGWLLVLFVIGCGGGATDTRGFTLTIEVSGKGSVALDHKPDGRETCVEVDFSPLASCDNDTDQIKTCVYEHVEFNPAYNSAQGCVQTGLAIPVFQAEATPATDWTWDHWETLDGSVVICDEPPTSQVQSLDLAGPGEHIKCRAIFTPPSTTRTLIGVVVSPANLSVPAGTTGTLTATGTYSDNTTADVTAQAAWSSTNTGVATVTGGIVTGANTPASPPTTTVTATLDGKSGSSAVTVTDPTPVSIVITPDNSTVIDGMTLALTATMTYSNGTTAIVNDTATWSSSAPAVASVSTTSPRGVVTGLEPGSTTITVAHSGLTDTTMVQVTAATLTGLTISPDTATIADGLTQAFTAMGTFSDGSTGNVTGMVTWSSADPAIATIGASTGLATTAGNTQLGTTTITASMGAISDTAQLTVTQAELASLEVTPDPASLALGRDRQFFANGTYTDGAVLDVTNTATWSAVPASRVQINATGLATTPSGATTGSATVTATLGAVSDSAAVTVTPAELVSIAIAPDPLELVEGQLQQLTVNGTFSDGTTGDVTSMATWMTSDMTVATVDSAGVCTAHDPGNATLTATVDALIDTLGLRVVPGIAFWAELTLPFTGGFSPYTVRLFPGTYMFAGHGTNDGFIDTVTETAGVPAFTRVLLGQGEPQAGARPLADGSKIVLGRSLSNFRGWMAQLDALGHFDWQQTVPNASRFSSFAQVDATTMTAGYVDSATSRPGLLQFDPATGTLKRVVLSDLGGFSFLRMEHLPGTSDVIATSNDMLFRFDSNLVPVWQQTIGGGTIQSLDVTPGGQILITRTAPSFTDAVLFAPDGTLVRATEYGPPGTISLRSFAPTSSGFLATGTVNGAQTVILLDAQGAPTVARSFTDAEAGLGSLQGALQNADGSIAIGARNTSRNAALKVAADLSLPGCADGGLGASIAASSITTATSTPSITTPSVTFTAVSPLPVPTPSTFTSSSSTTASVNACTN